MTRQKTNWDEYLEESLKDPEFARGFEVAKQELAVAREFRAARKGLGLTQAALAEASGVSRQLISRIENADCSRVRLELLSRVGEQLGLSVRLSVVAPPPVARKPERRPRPVKGPRQARTAQGVGG